MTNASTHDVRRPGAILSRLLVVLALVLFGLPQSNADRMATNPGPAAQGTVEQAVGIPSAQRHLLRAQLHDDTSPNAVVPDAADRAWLSRTAATISTVPHQSLLPIAIRILPPVRGPPAV